MSEFPNDLRYRESHEWVRLEGDVATVGITAFALEQLGDVIDVEVTREVGEKVSAGDPTAEIESVKAASDIYAPLSGEVLAINTAVGDDPEGLAAEPYGKGWMFKIKVSNPGEMDGLMSAEAYAAQVASGD